MPTSLLSSVAMSVFMESPVASERRQAESDFVADLPKDQPLLVVAPTRATGMTLVRRIAADRGALFGWESVTLFGLAQRVAQPALARAGLVLAAPLAHVALCARVVSEAADRGTLGRFAGVSGHPGFPDALARTLQELALECVAADALSRVDPDLSRLRRALAEAMLQAGLVDSAEVYRLAMRALADDRDRRPLLVVDPDVQHRSEGQWLAQLLVGCERALCTVPAGDVRTIRWLSEAGLARVPNSAADGDLFDSALTRLQRHLFHEQAPRGPDDDAVSIVSGPGESRECVEITRRLLWATEDGIPFERMAVLCRRASHYQPYLVDALRRASIPARFSLNSRRPDPAGRALLALLACRAEGFSAARFAEYLSLSVVPREPRASPDDRPATFVAPASETVRQMVNDDAAGVDDGLDSLETTAMDAPVADGGLRRPLSWERLIVEASVIGGSERWKRRLAGLAEALRQQAQELARRGAATTAVDSQLADLQALSGFALPVLESLAELPEHATWGVWLSALSELARQTLCRPSRVLSVLAELAPMQELGPVAITEVQWVLRQPLAELPTGEVEPAGEVGSVFVGSAEDARGMAFDLVCVPGLAEKIFPEKVREDPLLLDATRLALDAGLITNPERTGRERLSLRLAVGAAGRSLILSYPRIDLERVRPRVPSFYGLEVLRASEGRLPSYDELMARAEEAAEVRIGWPAPRRPLDAIDAAEHDLAVLEPPLARAQASNAGAGRYLLAVNAHLARALRFRARRWALSKFTAADGLVDPGPEALAALSQHAPTSRPYSATALQAYAACPYRFLLRSILGLRAASRPESIERLDAGQRGALFHDAQFDVLSRLRDADLLPVTRTTLEAALRHLDAALDRVAAQHHERLAPAIERVWQDGIEALRADLRMWLTRAAEDPHWTPVHFELAFGLSQVGSFDPASRPDPVDLGIGICLRGSIDLVERTDARLRATDHKTGAASAPQSLRIAGGHVLQPVLYGLALERLLPGAEVDSGRLYYCTARGGFEERVVPIDDDVRDALGRFASGLGEAVVNGFLPAAPDRGACQQCDYQVVCGPYEEQRTARKQRNRLRPLLALREEP